MISGLQERGFLRADRLVPIRYSALTPDTGLIERPAYNRTTVDSLLFTLSLLFSSCGWLRSSGGVALFCLPSWLSSGQRTMRTTQHAIMGDPPSKSEIPALGYDCSWRLAWTWKSQRGASMALISTVTSKKRHPLLSMSNSGHLIVTPAPPRPTRLIAPALPENDATEFTVSESPAVGPQERSPALRVRR